ncbi:glutamate dehydrogenase, putative [Plasmodium chabaudi chabaudi]|uniref:Glutamate dehydrogenase, putative n=1 Tax=Plasmodium chabaudi chabaudi TaxID=31271 RepID=A0A1C6YNR4_PLACU|nr:glutamate dehydrogenase, putative [Plasmodium chabaudi chabaudi]
MEIQCPSVTLSPAHSGELCFNQEGFSNNSKIWKEKYEQTRQLLRSYNLFSEHLINYSIDFYFNKLGFNRFHFEETSPELISKVVVCIITSKINEQYSSDKYFPTFEESHNNVIFIMTRVFANDNKTRLNYKMEKKIEEKYFNFRDMSKECYRLKSFRSVHSVFDKEHTYEEPLRTYILEPPTYTDDIITENETDLEKLMDVKFYKYVKGTKWEEIYYELNKAVTQDLTGQYLQTHYCEISENTFSLTIAVKRSNVIPTIFSLIGDCLNMHKCFSYSKYVEPLKNGVLLIILNVNAVINGEQEQMGSLALRNRIYRIVKSLKTLCLFNDPRFIQLSVKRIFTAEESAYLFIVIKFIAFFSTNSFSSYKNVENALNLKGNGSSHLGTGIMNDFYIIKEKLKSSKYTKDEILNCAVNNPRTIKLLFLNFERKLNKNYKSNVRQRYFSNCTHNETLNLNEYRDSKDIIDEIEDNHYKNILQYFYMFEKYAVKTNFFLSHKISFAISFDGALLKDSIYDAQPYSIIMILGLHFVGFHIRFTAISRGGIRIVISNNTNSYMHNYNNLFDEAYNLSYTQNFKNKDIPEGGSKGIILLDIDVCKTKHTRHIKNLAFYSYVNSILDLLVESSYKSKSSNSVGTKSSMIDDDFNFINNSTMEDGMNSNVSQGNQLNLTSSNLCAVINSNSNISNGHINKREDTKSENGVLNSEGQPKIEFSFANRTTEDVVNKIMNSKNGNINYRANRNGGNESSIFLKQIERDLYEKDIKNMQNVNQEDLIFLGPDENTGSDQLMDWACIMAKKRNYFYWKTFSTGKLRKNGGVPHDYYGMTTLGIETYIKKLCEKLNIKEESISRSIVGGPDGDLGSNAILQSKTKIISIIDGSGVLYDKNGLNKEELIRLAKLRSTKTNTSCILYNEKYLSESGFKISIEDHNVQVFDKIIKSGLDCRNTFFLNPLNSCELFNPCGGRPHSINIFNVNNIIINGECIYKYIVEGANVFISDEARSILENKNVILFKDASTNKGGVISSSLEVLVGLALSDKQFIDLMCSADSDLLLEGKDQMKICSSQDILIGNESRNKPADNSKNNNDKKKDEDDEVSEFYKQYVKEIHKKIVYYCEQEFECLWKETRRTKTPISQATNILSKKISELKRDILASDALCKDYKLFKRILSEVIPTTILKVVPFDQILKKVPYIYLKSLFASALASNYYYSQQFLNDLSAFNFFEYVRNLQNLCDE